MLVEQFSPLYFNRREVNTYNKKMFHFERSIKINKSVSHSNHKLVYFFYLKYLLNNTCNILYDSCL